jgi:hypothetical protein
MRSRPSTWPPTTRRRSTTRRACRRSLAGRSASLAMTSCARSSRSASRVGRNGDPLGLPDLALMLSDALVIFDHLKHTVTILANADLEAEPDVELAYAQASTIEQVREASPGRCPGRAASGGDERELPEFTSNMTRERFEAMVARIVLHPRRRRLPGCALAALVGAGAGGGVLDLPRPARGQPEPLHVLPRLRRLPGRGREPRAAADRPRARRLDQADRRHAPARSQPEEDGGSPRSCWRTRRSAPST